MGEEELAATGDGDSGHADTALDEEQTDAQIDSLVGSARGHSAACCQQAWHCPQEHSYDGKGPGIQGGETEE